MKQFVGLSPAPRRDFSLPKRILKGLSSLFMLIDEPMSVLALAVISAVVIRVVPCYSTIIENGKVNFSGADSWYHMRLVDNLLWHYPARIDFDPYITFPHGGGGIAANVWPHFQDWLIATLALVFGAGHPDAVLVEKVGAYTPVWAGALTVIAGYFLCRQLTKRWAAAFAALLLAFMPGEFLGRSILGYVDHHVFEALFSSLALVCVLRCLQTMSADFRRSIYFALSSGLWAGLYLSVWIGGLAFILVALAGYVAGSIAAFWRGYDIRPLSCCFSLSLLTAFIISLFFVPDGYLYGFYRPAMLAAIFIPVATAGFAALRSRCRWLRGAAPAIITGLGVVAGIAGVISMFSSFAQMLAVARSVLGLNRAILEVQPLLFPYGSFSLITVWDNFGLVSVTFILGLCALIFQVCVKRDINKTVLLIWCLLVLSITLVQRRFAYYLAVPVAVLSGYLFSAIYQWLSSLQGIPMPAGALTSGRSRKKLQEMADKRRRRLNSLVRVGMLIMGLALAGSVARASLNLAKHPPFVPPAAWRNALAWVKEKTPEPFDEPDFYGRLYKKPAKTQHYDYPETAYSIMAWWDYGHWILRMARRIPASTPFQWNAVTAARFFTAESEQDADKEARALLSRYVIVDNLLPLGKFGSVISFAGGEEAKYYEMFDVPERDGVRPVTLFYPPYYRTMAVRLYLFDAAAIQPSRAVVLKYERYRRPDGTFGKLVSEARKYPDYSAAVAFVTSQRRGNYAIGSDSALRSPVAVAALAGYRLVYQSEPEMINAEFPPMPAVKVFQYAPQTVAGN